MAEELKKFDELMEKYVEVCSLRDSIDYEALVEYLKTQSDEIIQEYHDCDHVYSEEAIFGYIWEELDC